MASNNKGQSERAAQRAAADALQRQIDALVSGEKPPTATTRPPSFRDFVNEKMAERSAGGKKSAKKK